MSVDESKLKTVAVLGGSYGGYRAAQVLASGLPSGWRVVLVDRNSHFNHIYNLPRYTVLPGHEHKAFIPYDNVFNSPSDPTLLYPHERVHGTITALHPHCITYTSHTKPVSSSPPFPVSSPVEPAEDQILHFDYAIYALGSHPPSSIELWESHDTDYSSEEEEHTHFGVESALQRMDHKHPYTGMKRESISRLRFRQQRIDAARQVLVVGGGALGIQFASDIAAVYPHKSVTLLHSRSRLLPRFDEALGDEVLHGLQEIGVRVILGERVDMSSLSCDGANTFGNRETILIKTLRGREIEADLVSIGLLHFIRPALQPNVVYDTKLLCTGQKPNTSLLQTMDHRAVNLENGMVRVSRTMQITSLREKGTVSDGSNFDEFICSTAATSPTLCGTLPPSPVETLIELDAEPVPPTASTDNKIMGSETDACHDTFVYPHLFAVGDAVDAFGAIKAGHTAYYQGEVAARNVIKLIQGAEGVLEGATKLEEYVPTPPGIKVSLGLTKSAYEVAGVVGTKDDGTEDLDAAIVWRAYGYKDVDEEGMWA